MDMITKALRSSLTHLGLIHLGVWGVTFGALYIALWLLGRDLSVAKLSVIATLLNPPIGGSVILSFYLWRWERIALQIARTIPETDRNGLARNGFRVNTRLLARLDQMGSYRLLATSIYVVHYVGSLASKFRLSSSAVNATRSAAEAEAHQRMRTIFLYQHGVSRFVIALAGDGVAKRRNHAAEPRPARERAHAKQPTRSRARQQPELVERLRRSDVRLNEVLNVLDPVFASKRLREMVLATYADGDGFLSTLSFLYRLGLSSVLTNDLRRRVVATIEAAIENPAALGWLSHRCFEYVLVAHLNGKDSDSVFAFLKTHVSTFCSTTSDKSPDVLLREKWRARDLFLKEISDEAAKLRRPLTQ